MSNFAEKAALFRQYNSDRINTCILKLWHGCSSERFAAVHQLCTIGYPSVHPLIEQLYDEDAGVVFYTKLALTRLGEYAISPLINALKNDERSQVRCEAAHVLGRISSKQATKPLIQCLNDSDTAVRQAVTYALMILIDPDTVEALCQALKDDDQIVRSCAAIGLGNIGALAARPHLLSLCEDSNLAVREYATQALEDTEAARLKRLMLYRTDIKKQHWRAKLKWREQTTQSAKLSVPPEQQSRNYSKIHNRPNSWVRQHKAEPFHLPTSDANTCRLSVIQNVSTQDTNDDGDDEELQDAYQAWDLLWSDRVEVLIEKLNEKSGHLALIAEVLGEIRDPRAKKPLLNLLPCEDEILQDAVIDALLALGISEDFINKRLQRSNNTLGPVCGRKINSNLSKASTVASARITKQTVAGYAIPAPPQPSEQKSQKFALNMDSIQQKIAETAQVQELLQTHFQEEDAPVSPLTPVVHAVVTCNEATAPSASCAKPFHTLDNARFVLLNMLLQKPMWKLAEITTIAAPLGLMASGALEQFNDMAYKICDEPLFEGDDPVEVNIALAKELLA